MNHILPQNNKQCAARGLNKIAKSLKISKDLHMLKKYASDIPNFFLQILAVNATNLQARQCRQLGVNGAELAMLLS